MFKILRIKWSWMMWCLLTDTGYRLSGISFGVARYGNSWAPFHVLARMCWRKADKWFAVSDEDFQLAYASDWG